MTTTLETPALEMPEAETAEIQDSVPPTDWDQARRRSYAAHLGELHRAVGALSDQSAKLSEAVNRIAGAHSGVASVFQDAPDPDWVPPTEAVLERVAQIQAAVNAVGSSFHPSFHDHTQALHLGLLQVGNSATALAGDLVKLDRQEAAERAKIDEWEQGRPERVARYRARKEHERLVEEARARGDIA